MNHHTEWLALDIMQLRRELVAVVEHERVRPTGTGVCPPVTCVCPSVTCVCPPVTRVCPPVTCVCPPVTRVCPPATCVCPPVASACSPVTRVSRPVTYVCPPAGEGRTSPPVGGSALRRWLGSRWSQRRERGQRGCREGGRGVVVLHCVRCGRAEMHEVQASSGGR